jgi:hypothetical protein
MWHSRESVRRARFLSLGLVACAFFTACGSDSPPGDGPSTTASSGGSVEPTAGSAGRADGGTGGGNGATSGTSSGSSGAAGASGGTSGSSGSAGSDATAGDAGADFGGAAGDGAAGSIGGTSGSGTGGTGGTSGAAGGGTGGAGGLDQSTGCAGVFNPDQLLDYELTLPASDWEALLADATYSLYFQAELRCGSEQPLIVGVQKKRSAGAQKVGLKIDVNHVVDAQTFYGLKKLSFENGRSSGGDADDGAVRDVLAEYFAWRMMQRGGALASRVAFARVRVNDGSPMVYANVERIDKVFLAHRLGEDAGWLYKKSGGEGDGLKTHESDGLANPHEAAFCFWIRGGGCPIPSAETLRDTLPAMLDIQGMLRFGAINALIANTDGLLFKDNNYYYYDRVAGGRVYFPWDLDTALSSDVDVLAGGVPGGTTQFTDVLFSNWRDDYVNLLRSAIDTELTQAVADEELARALSVAGAALDDDPYASGTADEAATALGTFWAGRLAAVAAAIETP